MNFTEKKSNVHQQLDAIYSRLESDISMCSDIETLKMIFDNEKKRVAVYAQAVTNELIYEIKEELRNKSGKAMVDDEMAKLLRSAGELNVSPISIDYSKAYISEESILQMPPPMVSRHEVHQGTNNNALLFTGAGIIIGGGLGAIAAKNIVGALIGATVGGAVGFGTSIAMKPERKRTVVNAEPVSKGTKKDKLNTRYFLILVNDRRSDMTSAFLNYIGRMERAYSNLSA